MTEHPILFNSAMVRAVLDGRKTQTRRVVKPQPPDTHTGTCNCDICQAGRPVWRWYHHTPPAMGKERPECEPFARRCPYGVPGDRLWARERMQAGYDGNPEVLAYYADLALRFPQSEAERLWIWKREAWKGIPSIHMPRWACRLLPDVVKVRVERVQDISNTDILAEGIEPLEDDSYAGDPWDDFEVHYVQAFRDLWDSINGAPKPKKKGGVIDHYESYPWAEGTEVREHRGKPWFIFGNPWVWVVDFKRSEK